MDGFLFHIKNGWDKWRQSTEQQQAHGSAAVSPMQWNGGQQRQQQQREEKGLPDLQDRILQLQKQQQEQQRDIAEQQGGETAEPPQENQAELKLLGQYSTAEQWLVEVVLPGLERYGHMTGLHMLLYKKSKAQVAQKLESVSGMVRVAAVGRGCWGLYETAWCLQVNKAKSACSF